MFKKILQYLVVVLVLASLNAVHAYKILVISPIPGKSHAILGDAMVGHLIAAGHEVTYITTLVPEKVPPGVTIVDTSNHKKLFPIDEVMNINTIMDGTGLRNSIFDFAPLMINMTRATIENPNVRKLLADETQQFDAVIAEWMFSEVYAGFAGVYRCPLIWFSSIEPHWMIMQLVDEIPNPAYSIDMMSDSSPPFTFTQRVSHLGFQIIGKLIQTLWAFNAEQEIYDKLFVPIIRNRYSSVPNFESLKYNGSLVLTNFHVSMGIPARLPPNVISIGGFHIKPDVKPLPEDLQMLMDKAKHGVIYFSMGSTLKSKHFPDSVKQDLLKMFGKLKQTIIWKFEENLPNTPSNVHIVKWAPQPSILAHKNCILFITHGGLLSTTETVHYGVPVIGIPVFGDQHVNVARAVKRGFALKVDLSYTMAPDLEKAIKQIVDNPKYTNKIKELSEIYHDRPVPPAQELVHWVEHVVKTRGGVHLRSPAFMVPWYQKLYLDLILVLVVNFLILKYVYVYLKGIVLKKGKEKIN